MPQTTLALLALALAMLFTLNQRELTTHTQLAMMRNEVGVVATGVAAEVFDHIGAREFDANTPVGSPLELTLPADFGAASSWDAAASIDQFHGHSTTVEVPTDHGHIELTIDASVSYVLKNGDIFVGTEEPQYLKQVTLDIRGPLGYRADVSRVFSYFD